MLSLGKARKNLLHVMVCIFDECCLLSAVMLSTAVRATMRV